MLKVVETNWNNEWTIEQIQWVERQYKTLFKITCKRKQELTGISDVDSTSNLEYHIEDSLDLWAELQIPSIPAPPIQLLTSQAPPIQTPLMQASPEQVPTVQKPSVAAPLILESLIQETPAQAPSSQGLPTLAPLASLKLVESNDG